MAYKRAETVPNIMMSYSALNSLAMLSNKEGMTVIRHLLNYVEVAHQKETNQKPELETTGLSDCGRRILESLRDSADNGIAGYWEMCEKMAAIRNKHKGSEDSEETTNSRRIVDVRNEIRKEQNERNGMEGTEGNERKIIHIIPPENFQDQRGQKYYEMLRGSAKENVLTSIINELAMNDFPVEIGDRENISAKIFLDGLDLAKAKECIGQCTLEGEKTVNNFLYRFTVQQQQIS